MKPATPLRFSSMLAATVLLTACGRSDLLPTHGKSGLDQSKSGPDASLPGGSDLQGHPWPVFGRDPQGTRRSPVDTSGNTGKLKWRMALGKPQLPKTVSQLSSPVISRDGTVYVFSVNRTLYAVAPPTTETRATLKWSYTAPAAPETLPGWEDGRSAHPPALGPDGTVYVSTLDTLYALDEPASGAQGLLKWSYQDPDSFSGRYYVGTLGSPTVGADGTVYIDGRKLLAFDPKGDGTDGVLKWSAEVNWGNDNPPVVARDGTVILGRGSFVAIQPPVQGTQGTLAWSFQDEHGGSSPAIAADGTVYVAGYDKYVRAFTPPPRGTSGILKWSYLTNSLYHTAPAIGADGTVYVAADVYGVFALRPNPTGSDGELIWRWYHGDNQWSSEWPAVGADGTIYLAGYVGGIDVPRTGNVHAISPPTTGSAGVLKWVFQTDGAWVSAPAIGADGTVYVTDGDTLYAIR